LPRGIFKTGVHAQGGIDIIPRLDNRIGYFLECVTGAVSTYTDQTIAQVIAGSGSETGVNTHLFGRQDLDSYAIPYFTAHRLLPHDDTTKEVGEIFQDCHMQGMVLDIPSADLVTARFDMLGRAIGDPAWDINPGWGVPTFDDDDTFLVTACLGSVKLSVDGGTPGSLTEFDARTARLTWMNNLLPPNRTRRIGNAHPKDFPVMSRTIGVDLTIFLDDYDVYVQTFGGPAAPVTDTGWSCTPLDGDIDVTLLSPALIGATTEYHQLRFLTDQGNCKIICRPIVLAPNQPVLLAIRCTITEVVTGRPFYLYTQNGTASYA